MRWSCLRSIAEAIDCEPLADDDADWRSRFLETKRAAQCALAAIPHEQEAKPVGWFNPWNDYQGYQQVAKEFEGSEGNNSALRRPALGRCRVVPDLRTGR